MRGDLTWGGRKADTAAQKDTSRCPCKTGFYQLNIDLPFDPAIPPLGIYPKDSDTGYSRGT
jgi:hypothetical protein